MRTLIAPFLALAIAASVYGCGPRDAVYDPSHFRLRGMLAPPEVVLPPGTVPGSEVGGIFTFSAHTPGLCCFIAVHTRVLVRKHGPADKLHLAVFVPQVPVFVGHPQRLRISFPSVGVSTTTRNLRPGLHLVDVPVPPALRHFKGNVSVTVDSAVDYVPVTVGTVKPHYGVIMLSVYFE